ncbi:hypothetical protein TNCV_1132171 [Trichonephila clavipes]|nr:hypothetical protein TNCV_1132171 [Trichonephila clavipes]
MRASGDGPRTFEPRSSDEDGSRAGTPIFKLQNHSNGKTLISTDFYVRQPPPHGRGSSAAPGIEPVTCLLLRDHNH